MKIKVLSAGCILMLCACVKLGAQDSVYQHKIGQWIGQSAESLYATWGMPMQTQQVDGNTFLAIYYQSESQPIDNVFQPYESEMSYDAMAVPNYGLPTPPPLFYCKTTFVIRGGIVADANFNGDDCY